MDAQRKSPMDHPAVVTFLILAIIAAMSLAAEVLKPLALAVLLSFALAPLRDSSSGVGCRGPSRSSSRSYSRSGA